MKNIFNCFGKDKIGEPPYEYNFLVNLPESGYPKYLKKIYKYRTGENLNLKHPKTFNEKIQWIKLYGVTQLMRDCTDKVKVRDYVKEKIGEEYLKPVLQIIPNESKETMRCHCEQVNNNSGLARQSTDGSNDKMDCRADIKMTLSARNDGELDDVSTYFDKIDFDKLPDSFVIKTNHGCKWHCIIKNKQKLLQNKKLFEKLKNKFNGWLEQEFWVFEGFELNYKNLEHKIFIESYMPSFRYIQVFCFNGIPKIYADIQLENETKICTYNEDFSYSDLVLKKEDREFMQKFPADKILKQTFDLSKILAENFNFVRVDWIVFNNSLKFEELTFTPYSGFSEIEEKWNRKLGDFLNL